jgi:hypothetical protein
MLRNITMTIGKTLKQSGFRLIENIFQLMVTIQTISQNRLMQLSNSSLEEL